jgi:PAS domain S-box-containing protein
MPDPAALGDPGRLAALEATGLLGGPPEAPFDQTVRLVRRCLRVPVALVSLVDADRQVFKGQEGLAEPWCSLGGTPLSHSFCQHVVADDAPLVVGDAREDARVRDNLAVRDLDVVAYLGVPLRTPDGYPVGSVCAIDAVPRAWTDADREALEAIAEVAADGVAARYQLRQRAEALAGARARSEALFRAVFDGITQLTGLLTPDGAVLEANQTALAFCGLGRGQVVGRPLWESLPLPPGMEARHRDALARAADGEAVRYEETVWDARGRRHVLDVTLRPAPGVGGLLLLEGRPVTEAVRLREVQTAMLAGLAGTWDLDLATGTVTTHGGTDALFGVEGDGPHAVDAYYARLHPDDRAAARRNLGAVVAAGDEYEVERRVLRPDGRVRYVRSRGTVVAGPDGEPARVVGAVADVTRQREAADGTAQDAARLQLALDVAQLGTFEHEVVSGRTRCDARAQALLDLPEMPSFDDFLGRVHPDDRAAVGGALGRLREDPAAGPLRVAYRVLAGRAAGGGPRHVVASVRGTAGDDGRLARVIGTLQDVTEREATTRALGESEARLSTVLDALPVGVIIADADGRVVRDNAANRAIWGVPPETESWEGYADWEGYWPDSGRRVEADEWAMARALRTGETVRGEHVEVAPFGGGPRRQILNSAAPVRDAGGRVVGGVVAQLDVTDRLADQRALAESEARFQAILDATDTIIYAKDLDGRYTLVNRAWTALTGLAEAEALGRRDDEVFPAAAAAAFRAHDRAVVEAGRSLQFDEAAWVDGEERAFLSVKFPLRDADGAVFAVGGVSTDTTAARRAAEALAASEERFRATFENAAVGIALVGPSGGVIQSNERLSEITGYSREELGGMAFQDITHPDDLDADVEQFERLLAGRIPHYQMEKRYRRKDGAWVWANLTVAPDYDPEGRVEHVISIIEDVTEKKAAEAALRALNDELEDRVAERTAELARSNAELDQFAYVASHDLKAPIRAIDSLATWIEEDAADALPEASARHLGLLRQRAGRMERLLDSLLAYSRAGRSEAAPEPVDAGALVRDVVATVAPPEGFDVRLGGDFPVVETARAPLALVFRNLIGNAIKHHDRPDGRVTVSAEVVAGPLAGGPLAGGGWAAFTVEDDGPGIAPEYRARVFGMFQTLRPRDEVEGSGMGLAVVKKTVEARGGAVTVGAAEGGGARFRFTWPLSEPS